MKSLTESIEWSLLQGIGSLLHPRLAKFKPGPRVADPLKKLSVDAAFSNNLLFLDTELREILLLDLATYKLPNATYEQLQIKLAKVCELLDQSVNLSLVTDGNISTSSVEKTGVAATQSPQDIGHVDPEAPVLYDNLIALLEYLNDGPESVDKLDLDLVHGANPRVFAVHEKQAAKVTLDAVHDCNDFLTARCRNSHSSPEASFFATQLTEPRDVDDQKRERAAEVLKALFSQFSRCEASHEILLHLSEENIDAAQCQLPIEMLLSHCNTPHRWQETQCLPYNDRFRVRKIHNLCADLRAWQKGAVFPILLEHRGLFNRCDIVPPRSHLSKADIQPLDHFLKQGYFLRDRQQARPSDFFTPAEKQSIALKLAQCLLDYFDSRTSAPHWDSGKVYLISPPRTKLQDGLVYVTFRDGNTYPHHPPSDIGHPVLLAFAKLLLEIDSGRAIDLSQCVGSDQVWAQLCVEAQNAKRAGSGLYAEAVSGCLYLHVDFPVDEDPQVELRKRIQRKILGRLKDAAKPSNSADRKRCRRDSLDEEALNADSCHRIPMPFHSLTPISKRQKFTTKERALPDNPTMETKLHELTVKTTRNTAANKAIVFRARQITLHDQSSLSETITDIISKNSSDTDTATLKTSIKDLSPLITPGSSISRGSNSTRGTALLTFRNIVPESFKEIIQSNESRRLTNGADIELSMDVDANFIGLTQLHAPASEPDTIADIVAIHGLNGHPYGSWLSKSSNPQMWLHDFLPEDAPNCRIAIYGYKSNIFKEREHPRFELGSQADRLNASLNNMRNTPSLAKRPIIFLAHSFGGLILAKALITARLQARPLHDATIGLFLLACPTRGFHVQDILHAMHTERQEAGEDALTEDKAAELVSRLGDGHFRDELSSFPDVVRGKKLYTFTEMRQTQTVTRKTGRVRRDGEAVMAAGANSVILGLPSDMEEVIPADKDHSDIVKFASRSDETYEDIKCRIQALLERVARYM